MSYCMSFYDLVFHFPDNNLIWTVHNEPEKIYLVKFIYRIASCNLQQTWNDFFFDWYRIIVTREIKFRGIKMMKWSRSTMEWGLKKISESWIRFGSLEITFYIFKNPSCSRLSARLVLSMAHIIWGILTEHCW